MTETVLRTIYSDEARQSEKPFVGWKWFTEYRQTEQGVELVSGVNRERPGQSKPGKKEANWVTIDERPVLIGGPGEGGGQVGSVGGSAPDWPSDAQRDAFEHLYDITQKIDAQGHSLKLDERDDALLRSLALRHTPEVLQSVRTLILHADRKAFDKEIYSRYDNASPGVMGFAVKSEKAIVMAPQESDWYSFPDREYERLVDHELGHIALWSSYSVYRAKWYQEYEGNPRFDRYTRYSSTSYQEAFAENYAAFLAAGGVSKRQGVAKVFSMIEEIVHDVPGR